MKFIHCFTEELKNKLINSGYKIINQTNGLYIFENSLSNTFNFNNEEKNQFIFSNKMFF
jgi:hypothetical protein